MCVSMVDIQSAAAEIRRGIKKIEDGKKPQDKNIMSASATHGGHKKTNKPKIQQKESSRERKIGLVTILKFYVPPASFNKLIKRDILCITWNIITSYQNEVSKQQGT